MDNNFEKSIYGAETVRIVNLIKEKLEEFEKHYECQFSSDHFVKFKNDKFKNHYLLTYNTGIINFAFKKDSNLPIELQDKCLCEINKIIKNR